MKKVNRVEEAKATIDNDILSDLIFYFSEYREERQKWAKTFKEVFCDKVDKLVKEMEEEEEENEKEKD